MLSDSDDFVDREIYINGNQELKVSLFFIDGLIDNDIVSNYVLKPLSRGST